MKRDSTFLYFNVAYAAGLICFLILFYFKVKKGCSTPPTAYLEDKNALGLKEIGEPPLGHGVKPNHKKMKK